MESNKAKKLSMEEKKLSNIRNTNNIVTNDSGITDEALYKSLTSKSKKKKLKVLPIIVIIAVVVGGILGYKYFSAKNSMIPELSYTTYTVETMDLSEVLSGSGTLKPADEYEVSALVTGEVLEANFEEGDIVNKDDILYAIDNSAVSNSIEKAEISLAQAQRAYAKNQEKINDLVVESTAEGYVVDLYIEAGDEVKQGDVIASIRDTKTMLITLPFSAIDIDLMAVGDEASVLIDGSFETIIGKVSEISGINEVIEGNMIVRQVTIEVTNPGAITKGLEATANIGDKACVDNGAFDYASDEEITAHTAGEVGSVLVRKGDYISEAKTMLILNSEDIDDSIQDAVYSLRNAEISLNNQYEELDNYNITSPISGTIVESNYNVGDTLLSNQTLCVIYDLSYLTMTLNIDELDIQNVTVGQKVEITAEAAGDTMYEGAITRININGTTSDGVTSYPVTVRMDQTEGLLPGMNVDTQILVAESDQAVVIPVAALERGNKVLVKSNQPTATTNAPANETVNAPANETTNAIANKTIMNNNIPEGYEYVTVTTGLSNDDYIEVLSGIKEGDKVMYYEEITAIITESTSGFMIPGTGDGQQGRGTPPSGGPGGN